MQLCASWAAILLLGLAAPAAETEEFVLVAFLQSEPAAHEWRPLADKLTAENLAAQQAWLERGPLAAALAALPASDEQHRAEAERQIGAARAQLFEKHPLSAEQFEELLVLRGRLEQASIERLARAYRIATYNTYHGDRAEYDRRRQAWENVLSAWRLTGSRPEQRQTLIAWLRAAGEAGTLPETPRFVGAAETAQAKPPAVESVVDEQPERVAAPRREPARAPEALAPSGPNQIARQPARIAAPGGSELAEQPRPTGSREPAASPRRSSPAPQAADAPARVTARRPVAAPRPNVDKPSASSAPNNDAPRTARRARAGAPAKSSPRIAAPAGPALGAHDVRPEGRELELAPRREHAPQPARVAEHGPRRTQAWELRISRAAEHEELATVDAETAQTAEDAVQINLSELSVRIGGFNFALAALESRLGDRGPWSADQLEPLVQQLDELNQLRSMLAEYRAVAAESEAAMRRLEPLEPVVTVVAARISKARADTVNRASAEAGPREEAELLRLEGLSERLARLVGGEQR
ncbi:MAG: hypothetical protein U0836_00395 [Pirellulales bacterium]